MHPMNSLVVTWLLPIHLFVTVNLVSPSMILP